MIGQQNSTTTGKIAKKQGGEPGYQNKQETTKHIHTKGKWVKQASRNNSTTENKKKRNHQGSLSEFLASFFALSNCHSPPSEGGGAKKNARSTKESKRKTSQTRGQNDRRKAHTKGGNKRGHPRRGNVR